MEYMEQFARPRWEQALKRYLEYREVEVSLIEQGDLEVPHWYTPEAEEVFA